MRWPIVKNAEFYKLAALDGGHLPPCERAPFYTCSEPAQSAARTVQANLVDFYSR